MLQIYCVAHCCLTRSQPGTTLVKFCFVFIWMVTEGCSVFIRQQCPGLNKLRPKAEEELQEITPQTHIIFSSTLLFPCQIQSLFCLQCFQNSPILVLMPSSSICLLPMDTESRHQTMCQWLRGFVQAMLDKEQWESGRVGMARHKKGLSLSGKNQFGCKYNFGEDRYKLLYNVTQHFHC